MSIPLEIQSDVPLAPLTTLGVGGSAGWFVEVKTMAELVEAISYAKREGVKWVVLGSGSNVLVPDTGFAGLVIKMSVLGVEEIESDDVSAIVKVGAGENFDSFVAHTVEKGWWGLENLSSIPGTVGATPVQNVGAYGAEISQTLTLVEVYDTVTDKVSVLTKEACQFGYRTSIFKADAGRYIILSVTFSLSLLASPQCMYADLAKRFEGTATPSHTAIRQAVQEIRSQKFPDWTVVGTAGSFFKNPIIPKSEAIELLQKYPELPHYSEGDEMVKLSLGYILDKICGLKGYRQGEVGLYENQALVLVTKKGTSASEVLAFAEDVQQKVFEKTGLTIEKEVTVL